MTEEHKRKIGLANTGKKHPHTEASKNKIRLASIGRVVTPETRKKISKAHIGKVIPKEQRIAISKTLTGRKLSKETRKKMSVAKSNMTMENRLAISNGHKGEKSHLWKGGINPLKMTIRKCLQYRQWRSDVFTRDDFTCQHCFEKGGRLAAHHIKSFSLILNENKIKNMNEALECEELWNLNNGLTLCEKCHSKTDSYGQSNRLLI